ncbi:hypothetical protein [Xylanimonas protaetiae]|uniref:Uncharacterized protein n=1 Tax=Xylanimonas protaetiae TaxID=2509457 RepID=A0A4P6F7W9_9MICO|nr:hypothetical protein [Xylanimonas protaetiae]QAY70389.1 hypothetical protein ET471_10390 [Xylanimonas protaetiae]
MGADTPVVAADLLAMPGACWLVDTASGTRYLVETTPDGARVARLPGGTEDPGREVAVLRRDRAWVPLLAAGQAADGVIDVPGKTAVGHPMILLLDIVRDGLTITLRQTTPVRRISRLSRPI